MNRSVSINRFYKHNNCDLLLGMDTIIDCFGEITLERAQSERDIPNNQFIVFYVASGSGTGRQAGESFNFKQDEVFFLLPHEKYQIVPTANTEVRLRYVRFEARPYSQFLVLYRDYFCQRCIPLNNTELCAQVFEVLLSVKNQSSPSYYVLARAMLIAVMGDAVHTVLTERSSAPQQDIPALAYSAGLVGQAVECVVSNPSEPVNIQSIVKTLHISENTLYKTFITSVGMAPKKYLTEIKIMESQKMLSESGVSLSEVAEHFGFSSPSHYSLAYKRVMGHSPRRK